MPKGERPGAVTAAEAGRTSRRRRAAEPEKNRPFVRAFADALRDILREERRRAA